MIISINGLRIQGGGKRRPFLKKLKFYMLQGGSEKILFKVLLTTPYASFETKFDHQKYSEPIEYR